MAASKQKQKSTPQNPFERYAGEPVTTTARFVVSLNTVKQIRHVTRLYGSQGRALQVGTEILIRLKKPLKGCDGADGECTRMTYKLLPRTIELLERLRETYGDDAHTFAAILTVLKENADN